MAIDLHAHTWFSDGSSSPRELVTEAARIGLSHLAVTDHDTFEAVPEARATGRELGVEILTGCEVTTALPEGIVHILGYDFDTAHAGLAELLAGIRKERDERNDAILDRLRALRVPVSREAIERHAHGRIIARPHIAKAMVEAGHVDDTRQAFRRYLRDNGPAFVKARVPRPERAIRVLVDAGGVVVMAHPGNLRLGRQAAYREVFQMLRDAGLHGIEVDHPSHKPEARQSFSHLAKELGLVESGGSDFHGEAKPHIALGSGDGTIDVPLATWEALTAARSRAS